MQKYPRAILYAVVVHVVLIALMVVSFKLTDKPAFESKDKGEEIINAVTVDAKKIDKELQKIKKAERKKQRELERAARKAKKARQKEEKKLADARKKGIAEQKNLEKKRQQEKKRLTVLKEKRKQEELRLQKLEQQKRAEEEQRQQKLEQQQREEELRNKLQAEQERLSLESDKQKQSMINQYRAMIEARVRQNWIVPPSAQEGMSCEIRVRLIPSGDVIEVQLTKTSGDSTFDRSVENAVYKASPLPVPPAESGLFNVFRDLKFPFTLEKKN